MPPKECKSNRGNFGNVNATQILSKEAFRTKSKHKMLTYGFLVVFKLPPVPKRKRRR
jgi:hypothetical protein